MVGLSFILCNSQFIYPRVSARANPFVVLPMRPVALSQSISPLGLQRHFRLVVLWRERRPPTTPTPFACVQGIGPTRTPANRMWTAHCLKLCISSTHGCRERLSHNYSPYLERNSITHDWLHKIITWHTLNWFRAGTKETGALYQV